MQRACRILITLLQTFADQLGVSGIVCLWKRVLFPMGNTFRQLMFKCLSQNAFFLLLQKLHLPWDVIYVFQQLHIGKRGTDIQMRCISHAYLTGNQRLHKPVQTQHGVNTRTAVLITVGIQIFNILYAFRITLCDIVLIRKTLQIRMKQRDSLFCGAQPWKGIQIL